MLDNAGELDGPSIPGEWGVCRDWSVCGCKGYTGNGSNNCACGHGVGWH